SRNRSAAVPAESRRAVTRDRANHPVGGVDFADPVIAGVSDVNIAVFINSHILRFEESRRLRRAAIAAESRQAVTGDCADHAGRRGHLANAIVVVITDVDVASAINRDAYREIE